MVIITPENAKKDILYLAPKNLCENCSHKNDCESNFRDDHLIVEILQDFEKNNIFYAGYRCIDNPKNNIPYEKDFSERLYFNYSDNLSEFYEIIPL